MLLGSGRRRAPFEKAGSLKMGGNFDWLKMMSLSAENLSISCLLANQNT